MTTRQLVSDFDRQQCVRFIETQPLPMTVTMAKGKKRSHEQNALQWKWCQEIAHQKGDETATEIQAINKLHFGVPILREECEIFRAFYDEIIKPLPYERKLKILEGDIIPITRRMTTKQKTRYLDAVSTHWLGQGMLLTLPEDKK